MDALYAQAAYCTEGEERARALLESVRTMAAAAEGDNKWVLMAASLCQQTVFELETHAIIVDGRIEAGDFDNADSLVVTPYRCQPLETLGGLEGGFAALFAGVDLWSLFIEAARQGDATMVDLLILAGVDSAAEDNLAIRLASRFGHLAVVERLLQDARVDPSAYNNFAFRLASEHCHLPVVNRLLLDARVDPSAGDNWAIRWASHMGHLAVVDRLLLDARGDPAADDNYAFRWASKGGHLPVVDRLLLDVRVRSLLTDEQLARYRSKLSQLSQ